LAIQAPYDSQAASEARERIVLVTISDQSFADGGLPGVRALGMELSSRSLTQVSVNIINHKETSLKIVYDEIAEWAKEYKVKVVESEIVGLIPASAAFEGMAKYLKLNKLSEDMIIDQYLEV